MPTSGAHKFLPSFPQRSDLRYFMHVCGFCLDWGSSREQPVILHLSGNCSRVPCSGLITMKPFHGAHTSSQQPQSSRATKTTQGRGE